MTNNNKWTKKITPISPTGGLYKRGGEGEEFIVGTTEEDFELDRYTVRYLLYFDRYCVII